MATNFHLYHLSLRRDREESAPSGDLKATPTNTTSSSNSNSNSINLFGSSPKHTSHHHRGFSFDKIKSKVSRRSSEPDVLAGSLDRRNSALTMIVISESNETNRIQGQNENQNHVNVTAVNTRRLRAQSLSLINSQSRSRSGSRSRSLVPTGNSTSRKQTKELVKLETAHIISKKLVSLLSDLGLQSPIPLKATNNTSSGSIAKSVKVYIANTNDCIFLAPASSASFTYEDVENGGAILHDDDDEDDEEIDSLGLDSTRNNSNFTSIRRGSVISDDESAVTSEEEAASPVLATPRSLKKKMKFFNSPNYLCTKIDSDIPIPHTFAVVIELEKDSTSVKDVKFEFSSATNILWPSGDPYSRTHSKERFKIGSMEWSTNLGDSDFYINTNNSNDVRLKNITPDDLARRTREYKLVDIRNLADGTDNVNTSRKNSISLDFNDSSVNGHTNSNSHGNGSSHGGNNNNISEVYKAGLYVFLLPIILPQHIPPTIISINGTLLHTLSINFNKASDMLNRKVKVCSTYNLPMVRTPPSFANSIADKPIYVNRVWNDSLHYIITFPKKYVSLGSEHVVNVKLVPLVKDVIIKRIKFNVLERITYVSKNLSKEYDFDSDDPYCVKAHSSDSRTRERVVSLCELKTKSKQNSMLGVAGDPYKEEVVKCPDNNLLFSCYEPDEFENFKLEDSNANKRKVKDKEETPIMIASPLDINIALPFLTTRMDKSMMTSAEEDPAHLHRGSVSRKASITTESLSSTSGGGSPTFQPTSPIIGALETNLSHRHNMDSYDPVSSDYIKPNSSIYLSDDNCAKSTPPENIQKGFTLVSKALYPDSNFRHIQISHRLQVCFRISKPDPKDGFKMHHYEVVVDTPLILLSSKCNDGSIQLPKYDDLEGVFSNVNSEISFRTPNFERNGISIKRLDENSSVEPLPSFEEATSSPSSPITRSISIGEDPLSRVPSNNLIPSSNPYPDEPAPAYERSPTSSSNHGSRNNSFAASSNIDEVVNSDSNNSSFSSLRRSTLRNSLSHSFAPSLNRSRNSSMVIAPVNTNPEDNDSVQSGSTVSASTTGGTEADDSSSPVDATPVSSNETPANVISSDRGGDVPSIGSSVATSSSNDDDEVDSIVYLNDSNAPLAPRSSSTGLTSVDNSIHSLDMDAVCGVESSLAEVELQPKSSYVRTENPIITGDDSKPTVENSVSIAKDLEVEDIGDDPDDNDDLQGSLYTQESAFDQKFPLLNHSDVTKSRNDPGGAVYPISSNLTIESENTANNLKISSDNLSVADSIIVGEEGATRAQDIYHTYL